MGRYTSVQSFTDKRTKVVEAGYKESAGAPKAARPEKVETVMGSNTGAGSCEFHLYRSARAREITRLETIESSAKQAEESAAFAAKVETNRKAAEERTKKNAEKRKKRKQKTKAGREEDADGEEEEAEREGGEREEEEEKGGQKKRRETEELGGQARGFGGIDPKKEAP